MTDETPTLPALLTAPETIVYLRLDTDDRDPGERLRNLIRRNGLPVIRRGRLQLFRREAIDVWLDGGKMPHPARQQGAQRLTTKKRGCAQPAR